MTTTIFAQSHPRSLLLPLALALCVAVLLPAAAWGAGGAEIDRSFPRGHVSALLHAQGLSHFALHSPGIQRALSSPYSPSTVAIVGVEWGDDVVRFASSGFRVIGVEPVPQFVSAVRRKIGGRSDWDVSLHAVAAGNPAETRKAEKVTVSYDNHGETHTVKDVPLRRLDDLIREELAVLSVDIQGDEVSVLKGASRLLAAGNVSTIWVEAIACNRHRVLEMLNLLDKNDFIILDFVPWGKPTTQKDDNKPSRDQNSVPKSAESFVFNHARPSTFHAYVDWMCAEKKRAFQWLQTDLLAVHRDVFEDVLSMLLNLGETACDLADADCALRRILHDLPQYGRQATLIEEDDYIYPEENESSGSSDSNAKKTTTKTSTQSGDELYDEEPEDYEDYIDHSGEDPEDDVMEKEKDIDAASKKEQARTNDEKQDL